MTIKTYTVQKRFNVEVTRAISGETMAEVEQKANSMKFDRFLRAAPGADLIDWEPLSGTTISEEQE